MQLCHGSDASDASLNCSFRWMWAPGRADAALLQFPTASLRNKYFLVEPTDFHYQSLFDITAYDWQTVP